MFATMGEGKTFAKITIVKGGAMAVVVTRHPALLEYLRELGMVGEDCEVLTHVSSPEQIRGKEVIGVLPLRLAAEAFSVVEVPLDLPPELRGKELSLEELRRYAGAPKRYRVRAIDPHCPECGFPRPDHRPGEICKVCGWGTIVP